MVTDKKKISLRHDGILAFGEMANEDLMELVRRGITEGAALSLLRHSVPLMDIVDTHQLVNRHELEKSGIDPDNIRVIFVPGVVGMSAAYGALHLLLLDNRILDFDDEGIYVLLAHELAHIERNLSGDVTSEDVQREGSRYRLHANRSQEINAINWEAMQAAKFGWDAQQLLGFISQLYGTGDPVYQRGVARELHARYMAMSPFIGGREVRVRSHRRRG